MAGDVILDTCAVVAIIRRDPVVSARIAGVSNSYLCTVSIGELRFGALLSQRVAENLLEVENFVQDCFVLDVDAATAAIYAEIKQQLKINGRMIPDNDIWIAATGLQYSLPILTNDQHFRAVNGITLETW